MGVGGWLHDQATLPPERIPVTIAGANILRRCGAVIGYGRSRPQAGVTKTNGTQLLVVLNNTQLNLINLINTTIHPSVRL